MKIVYASDIHEAYKSLRRLFEMTQADLYVIAGDLLYCAFRSWERAARYAELQQAMLPVGMRLRLAGTAEEIAARVAEDSAAPGEARAQARELLAMTAEAEQTMQRKYKRIAGIFSSASPRQVITIPGNYDMDLSRTALSPWDLHRKTISVRGVTIAGYGGAPVFTPGVPKNLTVPYGECFDQNKKLVSEPFRFFSQANPDILLLHHPPYGYLDQLAIYGSIGSIGIRDYLDTRDSGLVLSGHLHEDWGAIFREGKVFINPSNFGRFVEVGRIKKGGYFAEIHVENSRFLGGTLRQLEGSQTFNIEQCLIKKGKFRLLLLDLRRYRSLSRIKKRQKHIRAISVFNKLRGFFQKYETAATRTRIDQLARLIASLEDRGHEVAFHLLGSLNFGMAEETSDVDVVLYFRDQSLTVSDDVAYPVPGYVAELLEELRGRGLELSICDCLNLARVEEAIRREDPESMLLQRFIFYYTTCRCVNPGLIKEVENLLIEKQAFRFRVEQELEDVFRMIISSFRHAFSFKKYQTRLKDKGITVPPYIEELIWEYLEYRSEHQQRTRPERDVRISRGTPHAE